MDRSSRDPARECSLTAACPDQRSANGYESATTRTVVVSDCVRFGTVSFCGQIASTMPARQRARASGRLDSIKAADKSEAVRIAAVSVIARRQPRSRRSSTRMPRAIGAHASRRWSALTGRRACQTCRRGAGRTARPYSGAVLRAKARSNPPQRTASQRQLSATRPWIPAYAGMTRFRGQHARNARRPCVESSWRDDSTVRMAASVLPTQAVMSRPGACAGPDGRRADDRRHARAAIPQGRASPGSDPTCPRSRCPAVPASRCGRPAPARHRESRHTAGTDPDSSRCHPARAPRRC